MEMRDGRVLRGTSEIDLRLDPARGASPPDANLSPVDGEGAGRAVRWKLDTLGCDALVVGAVGRHDGLPAGVGF
jgi:hypothetical protein